jgi:hypothetical protein
VVDDVPNRCNPRSPPPPQGTTTLEKALKAGLATKGMPPTAPAAAAEAYVASLSALARASSSAGLLLKEGDQIGMYAASFAAPHEKVVAALRAAEARIPWDCLRDAALLRGAAAPAAFLERRRAAVRSAAGVAAAGWVAGVGDRHQANLMIEVGAQEIVRVGRLHAAALMLRGCIMQHDVFCAGLPWGGSSKWGRACAPRARPISWQSGPVQGPAPIAAACGPRALQDATCRLVAIDFGYSFGTALLVRRRLIRLARRGRSRCVPEFPPFHPDTFPSPIPIPAPCPCTCPLQLPVPEFPPFRLTRQLQGLFLPHTPGDVVGPSLAALLGAMARETQVGT